MTAHLQSLRGKRTYEEIKSHYCGRIRERAQQLPHRTPFCGILELLENFLMAVSIVLRFVTQNDTIFYSDAKKLKTNWRTIQKYYFIRQTNGERSEGRTPLPFFENREKCTLFYFWKKGRNWVHLWVKFSIQTVALRVFKKKAQKF